MAQWPLGLQILLGLEKSLCLSRLTWSWFLWGIPPTPLYERRLALASVLRRWCHRVYGRRDDLLAVRLRTQGQPGRAQEDCRRCGGGEMCVCGHRKEGWQLQEWGAQYWPAA